MLQSLTNLAKQHFGSQISDPKPLKGDGSDREIYRFFRPDGFSFVGVTNSHRLENEAFILLSRHFAQYGIPVPDIYQTDLNHGCYLLEDLGDITLADMLQPLDPDNPQDAKLIQNYYHQVIHWLPKLQLQGHQGLDYQFCYMDKILDYNTFMTDLRYFEQYFWNLFASNYPKSGMIQQELEQLALQLDKIERQSFVYRDFQSRNIMWKKNHPCFIDYQSGCPGAIHYDVATMLYASKARLNEPLRQLLIETYLDELPSTMKPSHAEFTETLYNFVLIRRLRSLGTYGFLPSQKGKFYFLDAIPGTIHDIFQLLSNHPALSQWTALKELFYQWSQDPNLCSKTWLHNFVKQQTHP
ncbi:MAG: phosphotransferase [SAR324 cluster bacterium]|nr:phosphotransferase [SAR324 cluster bacterium]